MNIQSITKSMIDSGIEENEAKCEVKMLLKYFCDYDVTDMIKGTELSKVKLELLAQKVSERINTRKPIQYIVGQAYFMGEYYKVTPDVLIPRDETELLVRKSIEIIKDNKYKSVLDIGTGSGCIACTIAKQTDAVVLGIDISTDALRVALDNVTKLGINNKAVFRKSDLFEKVHDDEKFDLIISNPPYIPHGTNLEPELSYEPQIALFANEDGLEFYNKIIKEAPRYLKNNGYLMFELGIGECESVKTLMEQRGFLDIVVDNDMAGIPRVIYGRCLFI